MVSAYLEKLHGEYLKEKINIDNAIANLQVELKENIEFIKKLEESTDVGFESFSPREINPKARIQIEELYEKQQEISGQMAELKNKQYEVIQKIDELNSVIRVAKSESVKVNVAESMKKDKVELDNDMYRLTLLETQENERQRISRELHDSTVQNLTSIVHKTELCSKLIDMDAIRCKLELTMMAKTLRDIINDTRQMIYNLRPMSFDDIGLDITIERAIDKIRKDKACNIGFMIEGESKPIKPVIGITLLRIIQEACNNAIKYAESDTILVKMIYEEDSIIVSIEDDGKGFDLECLNVTSRTDNSGFGLSMMRERVFLLSGEIEIKSEIDNGTIIRVCVPINNKEGK